jgi:hypothetical protein
MSGCVSSGVASDSFAAGVRREPRCFVRDWAGAGTATRRGAQTAVTFAAKILGSGNLVGPYPGLCITIHRGHMLCPADRGHRRLSAPSGSLGRTLFEVLYMDFREFPFHLGE